MLLKVRDCITCSLLTFNRTGGDDDVRELEEDKAHLFLERRGETMTVKELRDGKDAFFCLLLISMDCFTALREIDVDKNNKVCFIEYCMFKYEKTLEQLFAEKPKSSAELLRQLEEAIALHEVCNIINNFFNFHLCMVGSDG